MWSPGSGTIKTSRQSSIYQSNLYMVRFLNSKVVPYCVFLLIYPLVDCVGHRLSHGLLIPLTPFENAPNFQEK